MYCLFIDFYHFIYVFLLLFISFLLFFCFVLFCFFSFFFFLFYFFLGGGCGAGRGISRGKEPVTPVYFCKGTFLSVISSRDSFDSPLTCGGVTLITS